jgi:hypothetical protein
MALITCPECDKKISGTADSCPNCGYKLTPEKVTEIKEKEQAESLIKADIEYEKIKKKKQQQNWFIAIIIFAIIYIIGYSEQDSQKIETSAPKTQEEIHKEQIEKSFTWDGSHIGLTALIKKTMNDPDSYKHVETVYSDKGDHLVVKTTFRGKNKFGGVVTNWVMAKVELNGNVIEVLSQGP